MPPHGRVCVRACGEVGALVGARGCLCPGRVTRLPTCLAGGCGGGCSPALPHLPLLLPLRPRSGCVPGTRAASPSGLATSPCSEDPRSPLSAFHTRGTGSDKGGGSLPLEVAEPESGPKVVAEARVVGSLRAFTSPTAHAPCGPPGLSSRVVSYKAGLERGREGHPLKLAGGGAVVCPCGRECFLEEAG